ncbi:MAG: Tetratricopeptide repeat-containing protein [Chitinophagaceae bacterium]|nr:Tetratricopeptide repeat-containing protein [Chitinophagaceae bacterium]
MKKIFLIPVFICFIIAIVHSQPAPKEIDSLKHVLAITNADTTRVHLLRQTGYTQRNLSLLQQALALAKKLKYVTGIVNCYNTMGNFFFGNSNYPNAIEFYLQGLKISEENEYLAGIGKTKGNIGSVYIKQGNYRLGLIYSLEALSISKSVNNLRSFAIQSYDIAGAYLKLGKTDSALLYANQSYQYAILSKDSNALTSSLHTLGNIHHRLGNVRLALEYYRMAITYSPGYIFILPEIFVSMANLYQQTGEIDSCILYAEKGLRSAQEYSNGDMIFQSAGLLSSLYAKKDLPKSFYYYKLAVAGKDSMFNSEKIKQMENLSLNETLRQQEREIDKHKINEERKRNLQYAGIAIALIAFIILFLLLSQSIIVKTKFIEFFGILGLLAVFEFINLFIHPYLSQATNDSPVLMLVVLIAMGALLIPLHHKLEKWITKIMVEKNKKIRLESAKKTIQQLKG